MDAIKNEIVQEDIDWLESDLSNLDNYEPYEWQEGEEYAFGELSADDKKTKEWLENYRKEKAEA
jgi:hypothetical protein